MNFDFISRLKAFAELGKQISCLLETAYFDDVFKQQSIENKWFTVENCRFALHAIANMIDEKSCDAFLLKYQNFFQKEQKEQKIAVISAGNIPCAAFHDFFCIIVSRNRYIGKLSSQDAHLLPFLSTLFLKIAPEWKNQIEFRENLSNFDKIIATGSNNSASYFQYYFKEYPMLLRKNRNSVAILTGDETDDDLRKLSIDVFQYFGLGCRSVSKLFVPKNYDFTKLITIFQKESNSLLFHNGYLNNYEYHRAIYALSRTPYYDGNSFLLLENKSLASPIAVIYYEEYESLSVLSENIQHQKNVIQCMVSNVDIFKDRVAFGKTQYPTLFNYPDNEDIMIFCLSY